MNKKEYQRQYREKLKSRKNIKIPDEKRCRNCDTVKSNKEFHHSKGSTDGLSIWCKDCKRVYNKSIKDKLYQSNKNICKAYKERDEKEIDYPDEKKCYKCGLTKSKECFYKCKSRKSGLSDACKECISQYRDESKEKRNNYVKSRRQNDPEYKMYCSLQRRLHGALKLQGVRKSKRTMELVGCNLFEFIAHVESLWKEGMDWGNYGKGTEKWSLDHIRPCAAFNLLDINEQKQCFHYTNIQPLWNRDNFSKSSWYNGTKYTKGINNDNKK